MNNKIFLVLGVCLLLVCGGLFIGDSKSEPYDSSKEYNNPTQKKIIESGDYEILKAEYLENKKENDLRWE